MKKQTKIIYPGTFDPITNGHIDIVKRAMRLFDVVIIAIATQNKKNPQFSWDERFDLIKKVFTKEEKRVIICCFSGFLIDFAKKQGVTTILRGIRAISDFEYEIQLAEINRHLANEIETIFLTPAEKYCYISASIVREIAELGGDVTPFVPQIVKKALEKKFNKH